jgi:hypothetical protein
MKQPLHRRAVSGFLLCRNEFAFLAAGFSCRIPIALPPAGCA